MPPTQTRTIQRLRYMTDPLPENTLIVGPMVLNLYASIDQEDTNWIIIFKDILYSSCQALFSITSHLP
jgi:hypothetical protein